MMAAQIYCAPVSRTEWPKDEPGGDGEHTETDFRYRGADEAAEIAYELYDAVEVEIADRESPPTMRAP